MVKTLSTTAELMVDVNFDTVHTYLTKVDNNTIKKWTYFLFLLQVCGRCVLCCSFKLGRKTNLTLKHSLLRVTFPGAIIVTQNPTPSTCRSDWSANSRRQFSAQFAPSRKVSQDARHLIVTEITWKSGSEQYFSAPKKSKKLLFGCYTLIGLIPYVWQPTTRCREKQTWLCSTKWYQPRN
jgi:hypothetical protein